MKLPKNIACSYKNLFKNSLNQKKIQIYFSYNSIGDHYNPREKNYTEVNLNPITIKGEFREISSEKLIWKGYGNERSGVVEIIVADKYKEWFKQANKIVIENQEYMTYKDANGSAMIQTRSGGMIRIVLEKMN